MISVFNNISISERNSFHIDVTAREVIEFQTNDDLATIFGTKSTAPREWIVLSGGNNTLFTSDVDITILTPKASNISIIEEREQQVTLRIEAGAEWDDVVEWCVERELWGIENLSLIPGKAGAAPIQNIGAYSAELSDVVLQVEYFDTLTQQIVTIGREECRFGYRDSIFKRELRGRVIVTAIFIELSKVANPRLTYADVKARVEERGGATLRNIRDVICEIRGEKLPDTKVLGNAGSFFKNPIVRRAEAERVREKYPNIPIYNIEGDEQSCKIAAGWLIDQAGLKGYRAGAVGVHSRQALVLVNYGGATGGEVVALAEYVKSRVYELFGIEIDSEVNIL